MKKLFIVLLILFSVEVHAQITTSNEGSVLNEWLPFKSSSNGWADLGHPNFKRAFDSEKLSREFEDYLVKWSFRKSVYFKSSYLLNSDSEHYNFLTDEIYALKNVEPELLKVNHSFFYKSGNKACDILKN